MRTRWLGKWSSKQRCRIIEQPKQKLHAGSFQNLNGFHGEYSRKILKKGPQYTTVFLHAFSSDMANRPFWWSEKMTILGGVQAARFHWLVCIKLCTTCHVVDLRSTNTLDSSKTLWRKHYFFVIFCSDCHLLIAKTPAVSRFRWYAQKLRPNYELSIAGRHLFWVFWGMRWHLHTSPTKSSDLTSTSCISWRNEKIRFQSRIGW